MKFQHPEVLGETERLRTGLQIPSGLKDELCPDPRLFKPPVRDNRPCPDWS